MGTRKKIDYLKSFYVIRFDDGTYHTGTTPFTRKRVPFRKARVYTQRNHAALSISELNFKDATIIEITVVEPSHHEKEEKDWEETCHRALP